MKKTALCLFLCLLLLLPGATPALADTGDMDDDVLAPNFIVIDADHPETVFYAKNPDVQVAPASTTKVMTCILALEHAQDLEELVPVPDAAAGLKSTNTLMGLKRGESLPLHQLLYGLMLPSGNDAAITVACYVSGSVEAFAEKMNQKAAELGMTNTHFVNASGVYKSDHYSSPRDMAILTAYAMQNETFCEIVRTAEYTVPANDVRKSELELVNTNRLVSDPADSPYFYEYAVGVKTGSTVQGGKCLVAAAEKDGVRLIAVLLGVLEGGDKSTRIRRCFTDARMMFETIYDTLLAQVTTEELGLAAYTKELVVENARLTDPDGGALTLQCDLSGQSVTLLAETAAALRADPSLIEETVEFAAEPVTAPVAAGDVLASVTLSYQGTTLFTGELKAERAVEAYDPADETPAPTASPTELPAAPSPSAVPAASGGPGASNLVLFGFAAAILVVIVLIVIVAVKRRR